MEEDGIIESREDSVKDIKSYIRARIEEHKLELGDTVSSIQRLQDSVKNGQEIENIHVRIDNLTKKVLTKRSVIAELKHLLEIK
jgi:predicted RNase H-like nuclease (RuvC/YqgF family)